MKKITLNNWLNLSDKTDRIIITDKVFSQFTIKQQMLEITPNSLPMCLTIKQLIALLSEKSLHPQGALMDNISAFYHFSKTQKASDYQNFQQYLTLSQYNCLPDQVAWPAYTNIFSNLSDYYKNCKSQNITDKAQLLKYLLTQSIKPLWHHVLIANNQTLLPAEMHLINNIATIQHDLSSYDEAAKSRHFVYQQEKDEHNDVIATVMQHNKKHPKEKLAIITTSYQKSRAIYEKFFAIAKTKQSNIIEQVICSSPNRLLDYPQIKTPIWLLEQFFKGKLDLEAWKQQLYLNRILISNNQAVNERAIASLASMRVSYLGKQQLNKTPPKDLKVFIEKLKKSFSSLGSAEQKKTLIEWAQSFMQIISQWYCQGPNTINSDQKQVMDKWEQCWLQWSALDDGRCFNGTEALFWLEFICKKQQFQYKKTNVNSAVISIVNIEEIVGGKYDHVWLLGFNDQEKFIKENKFSNLPKEIIVKYKLPSAYLMAEQDYVQKLLINLRHIAKFVCSSHSKIVDQTNKKISIYLESDVIEKNSIENLYADELSQPILHIADNYSKKTDKISSSLLKDYVQCSFKAGAVHLFNLKNQEKTSIDLQPQVRGQILHECLAMIWQKLVTQEALLKLSKQEVRSLVVALVQKTLCSYVKSYDWPFDDDATQIELDIMAEKLINWLDLEITRPSFTVVGVEHAVTFRLQQHSINLRLDRVDKVGDDYIIIDYKTGQSHVSEWLGDQPDSPQMLLYFLAYKPKVAGIAYGQITNNKIAYAGLGEDAITGFGIKDSMKIGYNWAELTQKWHSSIVDLIAQCDDLSFKLNPKYGKITCSRCHLKSFCRINALEQYVANK